MAEDSRCVYCGQRGHAPEACPNRTRCKHGVYNDNEWEWNGNPPCWRCEVAPFRDEASREPPPIGRQPKTAE